MIKIILGIIITVLCGYIGLGIEKYYKNCLKIIDDYRNFIRFAERQTEFLKTGINDLISSYDYNTDELKKILDNIVLNENNIGVKYLHATTVNEICSFITELGKSDFVTKNTVIKNALDRAEKLLLEAEKDKKQKGELSRKLIIIGGIALVLLIL